MRLVRKLEELIEINSLISSALDRDSILKSITLSTLALLDTHGAEIWLLESSAPAPSAQSESEENATDYNGLLVGGPHKFQLVACAGTGEALATLPHMELPAGCIQFHEQQPFIENRDVLRKSMAQALGEADIFNGSMEAAFFAFGGTVRQVGLFTVHRLQARTFQQEDHYFLERLAIQAGISLHNSARYERVKTERDRAVTENRALKKDRVIVGHSRAIQELRDLIQQVAPAQAPVLLIGERGTGKELVAEAIHRESTRADRPLVRINCGGMVESLLESELFGYEKGAFTGADKARAGLLEEAHTGTLFLDEIGEMPASMQVRLLRFLQEGTTRRVGGNRERKLDVRVIAATNRDVSADPGLMRRDLYDRLATVVLRIPPLRDRREDIVPLALHFLRRYAHLENRTELNGFAPGTMQTLEQQPWQGNIRELENTVHRMVILHKSTDGDMLSNVQLAPDSTAANADTNGPTAAGNSVSTSVQTSLASDVPPEWARAKSEFEATYVRYLLRSCNGNISQAAARAGLDRGNFKAKMRRHAIESDSRPGRPPESRRPS